MILNVIQKTAGLVSIGMTFAPVYVSLPWTAITTLLPVSKIRSAMANNMVDMPSSPCVL